jgi:8-hydroxy-5-deazaflavin:NADPH oxidoreductase
MRVHEQATAEESSMADRIGIIGGTGPLGRGLAARLALVGHPVVIGSRSHERAVAAAAQVRELVGGSQAAEIVGALNADAATEPLVAITIPFGGLEATLEDLADTVGDRIVVSAVNPLAFDDVGPHPLPVEQGSAAQLIAARCPDARVVAALQSVSSRTLLDVDHPLDDDVPVLGDDPEAVTRVVDLLAAIPGCRPVPAGGLRLAGPLEALTCVLLEVNRRNGVHVGIRFSGL